MFFYYLILSVFLFPNSEKICYNLMIRNQIAVILFLEVNFLDISDIFSMLSLY